jgi:alkanesulfonate monooxygenase SsuD/methylene tetrahydromethanopterin reductase-like flavin-dependent oxidoreductase (luciferase family)
MAAHPFYSAKAMRDNLLIGDAAEVIEKLKKIEALGYDEFSFWIDSGMSFQRKRDGLRRLIDDVMPAFA